MCRDKPTAPQSVDRRHDPGYGPTGRDGRLIRQPAREYCSRQLCCSGSLTRPPDLGLLLRPRIHPCRDHIAPMSMTRGHVHSECTTGRQRISHPDASRTSFGPSCGPLPARPCAPTRTATAHARNMRGRRNLDVPADLPTCLEGLVPSAGSADSALLSPAGQSLRRSLAAQRHCVATLTPPVSPLPSALRAGRGA